MHAVNCDSSTAEDGAYTLKMTALSTRPFIRGSSIAHKRSLLTFSVIGVAEMEFLQRKATAEKPQELLRASATQMALASTPEVG